MATAGHGRLLASIFGSAGSLSSTFVTEDVTRHLRLVSIDIADVVTILSRRIDDLIHRPASSSFSANGRFVESTTSHPLEPHCSVIPGKLVALFIRDGLLLALAEITVALMGFTFVPLALSDPPTRRQLLLDQLRPDCCLDEGVVQEALDEALLARHGSQDPERSISSPSSLFVPSRVVHDSDPLWVIFTSGSTGVPKAVVATWSNLIAYIDTFVATSSSAASVSNPSQDEEYAGRRGCGLGVTSRSRQLLLSSATFDPSIGDIFSSAILQSTLVTASRDAIESSLGHVIALAAPTHIVTTPALWATLAANDAALFFKPSVEDVVAAPVKVFLGGEKTPGPMRKQWLSACHPCVELYNIFGVTEATIYQSACRMHDDDEFGNSDAIIPIPNATEMFVDISDEQDGSSKPCSEMLLGSVQDRTSSIAQDCVGELILHGPQVCCGYYDDLIAAVAAGTDTPVVGFVIKSAQTPAGRFAPDSSSPNMRWYRTGDVVTHRRDDERNNSGGRLNEGHHDQRKEICGLSLVHVRVGGCGVRLVGRRDFQVKVNGIRLSLEGVEAALQDHLGTVLGFTRAVCTQWVEVGSGRTELLCWIDDAINQSGSADDHPSADNVRYRGSLLSHVLRRLSMIYLPHHSCPLYFFTPLDVPVEFTGTGKLNRTSISNSMKHLRHRFLVEDVDSPFGVDHDEDHELDAAASCRRDAKQAAVSSVMRSSLLKACSEEFGVPVRLSTHFFRAGGDSLTALKVMRKVFLQWSSSHASGSGTRQQMDNYGGMPEPFLPKYFAQYPVLVDLARFLEERSCASAQQTRGNEADAATTSIESGEDVAPQMSEVDEDQEVKGEEGEGSGSEESPTRQAISTDDVMLLMECVGRGEVQLARALLALNLAPVDGLSTRKSPKLTPLHCAVVNNSLASVRLLVEEFGAKLTIFDMEGVSPGHAAARISATMLKYFISRGYPPTSRDHRCQTLLHVAARHGAVDCVEYILYDLKCLAIDVRDCWQRTAVHWAILHRHADVLVAMSSFLASPACSDGLRHGQQKHQRREVGTSEGYLPARQFGTKSRLERLAAKRTHLVYETPLELCTRLYGKDDPLYALCLPFAHML